MPVGLGLKVGLVGVSGWVCGCVFGLVRAGLEWGMGGVVGSGLSGTQPARQVCPVSSGDREVPRSASHLPEDSALLLAASQAAGACLLSAVHGANALRD